MPTPRDETEKKAKPAKQALKPEDAIKLLMTDPPRGRSPLKKFENVKGDNSAKADIVRTGL